MHVDACRSLYIYYTALLNVGGGRMGAHGTRIAMREIEPCTCAYMLNKRGSGAWVHGRKIINSCTTYIYTHPLENCICPSGRFTSHLPFADGYRWYAKVLLRPVFGFDSCTHAIFSSPINDCTITRAVPPTYFYERAHVFRVSVGGAWGMGPRTRPRRWLHGKS